MKTFDRYPYLKHSTVETMNAHKDTQHPAGQTRATEQELKGQQTLSDYIRSIKRAEAFDQVATESKITFEQWVKDQWWASDGPTKTVAWLAWNTAMTRGKVS